MSLRSISRGVQRGTLAIVAGLTMQAAQGAPVSGRMCLSSPFSLQFDHDWKAKRSEGASMVYTGEGSASTKIPLTFAEDGTFSGDGSVTMATRNRGRTRGVNCRWTRRVDITWSLRGHVSEVCEMEIDATEEITVRSAFLSCETAHGTVSTQDPGKDKRTVSTTLRMKAEPGAQVAYERPDEDGKEVVMLTLIEDK